jgi:hypothetical protein
MDFKKLIQQIDSIEKPKKQLTEASMNISFNADTADEVGVMLDRLKGIATPAANPVDSNMGADMQKFKAALGGMEGPPAPPAIANAPEEEYAGVDAVTGSGDDIHKSKDPADIRVKDPSIAHDIKDWANEPEEKHSDHNTMIKDLSGGLNREKKMFKPAAKGDNPMAVESIKSRLLQALSEKKAKPDFLDMDKDGNKKEPMKKALKDKKTNEAAKPDFLDMDKDGNKKEPMKKAVADKKKEVKNEGLTNQPSAPRSMNYLMKMSKGGDEKYFVFTYEMPYGIHYPEAFKKQLKDNPIAQQLMSQGYSQPDMISGIPDDIDAAIKQQQELAKAWEPKKSEYPVQYYDAVNAIKRYTKLKDLLNTVSIEK